MQMQLNVSIRSCVSNSKGCLPSKTRARRTTGAQVEQVQTIWLSIVNSVLTYNLFHTQAWSSLMYMTLVYITYVYLNSVYMIVFYIAAVYVTELNVAALF